MHDAVERLDHWNTTPFLKENAWFAVDECHVVSGCCGYEYPTPLYRHHLPTHIKPAPTPSNIWMSIEPAAVAAAERMYGSVVQAN